MLYWKHASPRFLVYALAKSYWYCLLYMSVDTDYHFDMLTNLFVTFDFTSHHKLTATFPLAGHELLWLHWNG